MIGKIYNMLVKVPFVLDKDINTVTVLYIENPNPGRIAAPIWPVESSLFLILTCLPYKKTMYFWGLCQAVRPLWTSAVLIEQTGSANISANISATLRVPISTTGSVLVLLFISTVYQVQ